MMCGWIFRSPRYRRIVAPWILAAFAGLLFFPLVFPPVSAQVVINELYYDHPGADAGHEFIELINVGGTALCLSGYSLQFHNGAGEGWSEIWTGRANDTIAAGHLFLIGDDRVVPLPHSVTALAIQNGPDAIRLTRGGTTLDLLGYGGLDQPAYCEWEAAPGVAPGSSLGRAPDGADTDNNVRDFHELVPSPGRFNLPRSDLAVEFSFTGGRVVEPFDRVKIAVDVSNRGLHAAAGPAYWIEIHDSTRYGEELLERYPGREIAVEGRRWFETAFRFDDGYHRLTALVLFADDERPENNRATLRLRAGTPPVIISEVMSYPTEPCPQYIELFNSGSVAVDCGGWLLRDHAHRPVQISAGPVTIEPGAYLVVTADADLLRRHFPRLDAGDILTVDGAWPAFNHTGSGAEADSVLLFDRYRLMVEGVSYPAQTASERGRSLERTDCYPGTGPHAWTLSVSPAGGTPGGPNSIYLDRPPEGGALDCSPNPFALGREVLLIAVAADRSVERVVVSVYGVTGERLWEAGSAGAVPALFTWEGRREGGAYVTPGVYIVVCEKYFLNGERGVERVVVGCGTKRNRTE